MTVVRKGSVFARWAKYYVLCAVVLLIVLIGLTAEIYSGDDPVKLRRVMEGFGVVVVVAMGLLSWGLWWIWARRLRRMSEIVRAYAQGDYTPRLPAEDDTELGALSEDLNWMAQQLHLKSIVERSRQQEQEAVLASMTEGVMAVDADACIIHMNRAARRMLDLNGQDVEGRLVSDIIRQEDFNRFIQLALVARAPMDADLLLKGDTDKSVIVRSSVLTAPGGQQSLGVLIVINDVTRVRHLENMRRDFVANVSHELKTPITSIKGFMETLMDGALEDKEHARKFLEIIARQADRLDAIIEDLLSLSRIEQDAERNEIGLKTESIRSILQAAMQATLPKAEDRQIVVDLHCSDTLTARVNAPLLEQAVINLVDNAIKYSNGKGKQIDLAAEEREKEVIISVVDQGPGIAREHHQRIFERFYRVDKSRSRQLGGTGLGLSIVKHIAQAHKGSISVQSAPGKGSTFSIHLPK